VSYGKTLANLDGVPYSETETPDYVEELAAIKSDTAPGEPTSNLPLLAICLGRF